MADFLVALAEFDRARAWEELGYAGLFPFLHRGLGLSKAAAFFRMRAAQLLQRYPEIADPLRDGRLCLTSVVELSKVLTTENRDAVLPRFFHCSTQEAKAVSAELAPLEVPPRRAVVTSLPAPATNCTAPVPGGPAAIARGSPRRTALPRSGDAAVCPELGPAETRRGGPAHGHPEPPPRDRLAGVPREARDRASRALSCPAGASIEEVLEAGLDLVLAKDAKEKALVAKPRAIKPPREACVDRHDPAEIRREVWSRDGGRCQWMLATGGICGSRLRPELDHIIPRGRGGPTTVANLRVLCRAHNDLAARLAFGEEHMRAFRRSPGEAQTP